jgi:hypothetical protein
MGWDGPSRYRKSKGGGVMNKTPEEYEAIIQNLQARYNIAIDGLSEAYGLIEEEKFKEAQDACWFAILNAGRLASP